MNASGLAESFFPLARDRAFREALVVTEKGSLPY